MTPSPSEIEELLAALRAFTGEVRGFRKVRRNPDGLGAVRIIGALLADRKALLEAVEQIAADMEYAVAGGMAWISHSECYEFTRRLRAALSPDEGAPK